MSNGRAAGALGSLIAPLAEPQTDLEDVAGIQRQQQKKPQDSRSQGKNRNPEYHKLTVYIPRETRKAVAVRIANDGGGMELSVLVTKLLDGWTAGRFSV